MKKYLSLILIALLLFSLWPSSIFGPNIAHAGIPRHTITNFEDWLGVNTYYSDQSGDVSGTGQASDLTGFGITNDENNLYLRWDLLSGNGNFSYNYVAAFAPIGTNTPEFYAYVEVKNGAPTAKIYFGGSSYTKGSTVINTEGNNIRVLATFPFSDFNINSQQLLTNTSKKSIWAGSANNFSGSSAFADVIPNGPSTGNGYLDYDTETVEATPRNTGPLITMKAIAENSVVGPGETVNYTLSIKM